MRSATLGLVALVALVALACSDATGPSEPPAPQTLAISSRHICSVTPGGTTCWGQGALGELGNGTTEPARVPTPVSDAATFQFVTAGYTHTCGLDASGAAWCWGSNFGGELGTGSSPDQNCAGLPCQTRPVAVATSQRFTQLAAGDSFTCGLTSGGAIFCWGRNDKGQLGTTATTETCDGLRCSRQPIASGDPAQVYRRITAGQSHLCALNAAGEAWCWGYDGHTVDGAHVHMFSPEPALNSDTLEFTSIASGGYHTCALRSDGQAWCWGLDAIGAGPAILEADHPVPVAGEHRFTAIRAGRASTCALEKDGRVFCWGANLDGSVGVEPLGSTVLFDSPQAISGNLRFTRLDGGGGTFCGTTTTGTVACWGRGDDGLLLNGDADSATPVTLALGT